MNLEFCKALGRRRLIGYRFHATTVLGKKDCFMVHATASGFQIRRENWKPIEFICLLCLIVW
jgi:hypothetical protein